MTTMTSRRFFSGDSLRQALIAAANHFNLDPDEIAYRAIEKRHGFLKTRRRVVIEVDPEAPKRSGPAPVPAEPAPMPSPAAAPPVAALAAEPAPVRPAPAVLPLRNERGAPPETGRTPPERDRGRRGDREDRPRREGRRDGREGRSDRRGPGGGGSGYRERRGPGGAGAAGAHGAPGGYRERSAGRGEAGAAPTSSDLIALPEAPRRTSERFPIATGPAAEAAAKALAVVLDVAGLELEARIHQGEERLEVELHGTDTDPCFSDGGELLMAIEHLLPRLIRGMCGEIVACRVDCDNFHEIRAEQLRSLAQNVANEVRRLGRQRTLEPMNPSDRRVIHMTLADDPAVVTESEGQGYFKRITVRPT